MLLYLEQNFSNTPIRNVLVKTIRRCEPSNKYEEERTMEYTQNTADPKPTSTSQTLTTSCKQCGQMYNVLKDRIFSGGEHSKYATRCPICGFGKALPFKVVWNVYGKLEV